MEYFKEFMGNGLRLDQLNDKIRKFVRFSQEGMFYRQEPLPKYSELLFSHLLFNGALERNHIFYYSFYYKIGKTIKMDDVE